MDRKKRVLYQVIQSRGAEHDSTAFKNSALYMWLLKNWQWMNSKGLYFIGDSAYVLKSFLLTPFDNSIYMTPKGSYHNILIVDACMCLHNFIVGFREEFQSGLTGVDPVERDLFNDDCRSFLAEQLGIGPVGVYGGGQDIRHNANGTEYDGRGRSTNIEAETTAEDRSVRERIR